MLDKLIHKYLWLPYTLHVHEYRRVAWSKKTVVFLHGIGSSGSMWRSLASRDFDATIVTVDLLGFGQSAKPTWARYDAATQAKAVAYTLSRLNVRQPVIIVGHSMGSLVAVEIAKKYPKRIESLILCSPPFYQQDAVATRPLPSPEILLRKMYTAAQSNPLRFAKLTSFATKYKLVNAGFNVTSKNISTYIAALEGMILNQTSFDDALQLKIPTHIIRGNLDPVVVTANLKKLRRENPNISVTTVAAGHEIRGLLLRAVSQKLQNLLARPN